MQRDRVREILAPFWEDQFLPKGYLESQREKPRKNPSPKQGQGEDILETRLSVGGEALSMSGGMIYGAHCIR
jgi:hypothetical protein